MQWPETTRSAPEPRAPMGARLRPTTIATLFQKPAAERLPQKEADLDSDDSKVPDDERRLDNRQDVLPDCTAVVRIGGIPVHRFQLKDVSRNGTCFLVEEDSSILRHLHVGQEIEIQLHLAEETQPSVFYRSQIMHITRAARGSYHGHRLVGVQILSKLTFK
jgi:hypothetical protein